VRPGQSFECVVESRPGALVIRLVGEFDLASTPDFRTATREAGAADVDRVVLDLRDLEFCDSSGLHAIVDFGERLPERMRLEVIPGPEPVGRLFELSGVAGRLNFVSPASVPP
jgi:anti-sigma B factor antagonist